MGSNGPGSAARSGRAPRSRSRNAYYATLTWNQASRQLPDRQSDRDESQADSFNGRAKASPTEVRTSTLASSTRLLVRRNETGAKPSVDHLLARVVRYCEDGQALCSRQRNVSQP